MNNGASAEVLLGIEGGGTKTTWCLVDEEERIVASGTAGPGNVSLLSDAELVDLLRGINRALPGRPSGVAGAFAGVMGPELQARLDRGLRAVFTDVERVVAEEDSHSALWASHPDGQGIAVIAGTGCNVLGQFGTKVVRVAGWGHIIGDPGSAWDIARRGLQKAYRQFDETGEVSALGRGFFRATGCATMESLIAWIMERSSGKTEIAGLSGTVFEVADAGDAAAKGCASDACASLAEFVAMAARRLGMERPPVGLIGGLFENRADYRDQFEREVTERFAIGRMFLCTDPGNLGAARMARVRSG